LNTPVPDYMLQACASEHEGLLDYVRARAAGSDLTDLVYALAAKMRLRRRRTELVQELVALADSVEFSPDALCSHLIQLSRLETYERKTNSRIASLLARS
jgi:hypothetical protein